MDFNDIKKANEGIKTINIKGNNYSLVNQRIKAFRMVYPQGFILTDMVSNENGICVFRATCGFYKDGGDAVTLGTGTAYEREDSNYINKTSYIENCETSAVGRALGMCGFGIDVSVASYEEVANAIKQQEEPKQEVRNERTASPRQVEILKERYTGANLEKLLAANNISRIEDIPMKKASELIGALKKREVKAVDIEGEQE